MNLPMNRAGLSAGRRRGLVRAPKWILVPPSDDLGRCRTCHTGEGCALKGSTFAEFVARFWPEDLAEVFAVFATGEEPTGDSIADDKVRFLWEDADMVQLRSPIRVEL